MIQQHTHEHELTFEQCEFLNHGPAYVIPCQLHILSTPNNTLLRHQLTRLFNKYHVDIARSQHFKLAIQNQFDESFTKQIPKALEKRVQFEYKLMQSIRLQLKKNHLILRRTADENNQYYLGNANEFKQMVVNFFENKQCFELLGPTTEYDINKHIQTINNKLQALQTNQLKQFELSKDTKFTLPYLYFLPNILVDHDYIQLEPRLSSCKNTLMSKLAQYLDSLLRDLYENYSQTTRFINGTDFLQKFQQQTNDLTMNTHFVTFQLHNLYIRVSHADLLLALNQFLVNRLPTHRFEHFTIETIERLTELVLSNQIFTYENQIYRYVKGGTKNFLFIQLLVDIYIHYWQTPLLLRIRTADKFYGRFHDKGFFTWNDTTSDIVSFINEMNRTHPDIQCTTVSNKNVHFLNVHLYNENGQLYTNVYHESHKQSYLLPYTSLHPRLLHRQWFRFALLRAGQYCCSYDDFENERLYIEMTFLLNGYTYDNVEYLWKEFLKRMTLDRMNRTYYSRFRIDCFRHGKQIIMDRLEHEKLQRSNKIIYLYYLYDWGSRCHFNEKFYHLWKEFINNDSTFKKHGFLLFLKSKHCYVSNILLHISTH